MLALELRNDLAELSRLYAALTAFAGEHGLPAEDLWALDLALEEVVVNVMKYAYDDARGHTVAVRLTVAGGEVIAEVEDDGRPFNPLTRPDPDFDRALGEMPIGGLGIHLVRQLMDGLEYRRQADRNLLVLRKRLTCLGREV